MSLLVFTGKSSGIPKISAVYVFIDIDGSVLYVGATSQLKRRMQDHWHRKAVIGKYLLFIDTPLGRLRKSEDSLLGAIKTEWNIKMYSDSLHNWE